MFGTKSNPPGSGMGNPAHQEIRHHTGSLISIANRAEAASLSSGEPTITNAGEVLMARELLAAQEVLLKSLETALVRGNSLDEIQTHVFEPVIESSVVRDVAWLVIQNVMAQAKNRAASSSAVLRQ